MMSGAGGVAFADPDATHGSGDDGATTPADTSGSGGLGGSPSAKPTSGPVPPPKVTFQPRLGPLVLPDLSTLFRLGPLAQPGSGPLQWGSPSSTPSGAGTGSSPQLKLPDLPNGTLGTGTPAAPESSAPNVTNTTATADSSPPASVPAAPVSAASVPPTAGPPAPQSPSISFAWLIPSAYAGKPIVFKNPLPDTLPIDLHKPLGPQLLPPPVVAILEAAAQQIPLTGLMITPLLDDVLVPPFVSDVIIPALLSDVIVPTISFDSLFPGGAVTVPAPRGPAVASKLAVSIAPPPDLAPTGMDAPLNAPAPLAPVPDLPQQPPVPPPPVPPAPPQSSDNVAQLSEPVAYRAGYSDYLRNAGMAEITSIALPGVAGILIVTLGGGFIGYRQARAGHIIRAQGIARFLR
jgi:hypothetical protein